MKKILILFAAMCCMMVAGAQTETPPNNAIYYTSNNGIINPQDCGTISTNKLLYGKLYAVSFSADVKQIGYDAFKEQEALTSIIMPNSVEKIDISAFKGCYNLTSVTFSSALEEIRMEAFKDCSSLTSVTFPNSLTAIDRNAFYGCSSLTSITIPSSVKNIWDGAFCDCSNLKTVICERTTPPKIVTLGEAKLFDEEYLPSIYVPHGAVDAYKEEWSKYSDLIKDYFFEIYIPLAADEVDASAQKANEEIDASSLSADVKSQIKSEINEAAANAKTAIAAAESEEGVDEIKNNALASIELIKTQKLALDTIYTAMQGEASDYLTSLVQENIDNINAATKTTDISKNKDAAIAKLKEIVPIYKASKADVLGTLNSKQAGPAVEVTDQDGKEIILYNPKKVKFVEVE